MVRLRSDRTVVGRRDVRWDSRSDGEVSYVVRFRYPGTTSGAPVGLVYALDIGHLWPGTWSYVKDPAGATHFDTLEDAERVSRRRYPWHEATVVPMEDAEILP